MTPQEIRSKFEHGAPDRFLAFYYAIQDIVSDEITCNRYKQQKIAIITSAAKEVYKAAKAKYMETMDKADWIAFCNAKRTCMLLGVRI